MANTNKSTGIKGVSQRSDTGRKYEAYVTYTGPRGNKMKITVPGRFNTLTEAVKSRMQFITNLI